jgi:hypothetical protein
MEVNRPGTRQQFDTRMYSFLVLNLLVGNSSGRSGMLSPFGYMDLYLPQSRRYSCELGYFNLARSCSDSRHVEALPLI